MRILITGGAGFIGSHITEFYAKKKSNRVIVLDNLMRSKLFGSQQKSVEFNWRYLSQFRNVERILGDVRKSKDIAEAIGRGVDCVIHTAGQPGVGFSMANPEEDFQINAIGTFNVLECIRQKSPSATFIYCSTNKVYGENVHEFPLTEMATRYRFRTLRGIPTTLSCGLARHTPYGVSKYVGDLYAQEYAHSYRMKVGIFRMSCIYGTRQFGFEDQGWIAWFTIATLTRKPIVIYGDGKQVRDVLYVTDLVAAFDSFLESRFTHSVYNIGGGPNNTLSLLECLQKIEQKTGKKIKPRLTQWRDADQKVYISDISKVQKELHWKPTIAPDEGIEHLIGWVRNNLAIFNSSI